MPPLTFRKVEVKFVQVINRLGNRRSCPYAETTSRNNFNLEPGIFGSSYYQGTKQKISTYLTTTLFYQQPRSASKDFIQSGACAIVFTQFSLCFEEINVKMPVFHTKTIEGILEPVAQQVRSLFLFVFDFFLLRCQLDTQEWT